VGHVARDVTRLGPGRRIGLWVAGCPLACPGCLTEDDLVPADAGADVPVEALAAALLATDPEHAGLTISGGEPLWQSAALVALLERVLERRPNWNVMLYSGWRLEAVRRRGQATHRRLIELTDLLVDGPYVHALREPGRLWRGSVNQRLLPLSDAGHAMVAGRPDVGVGIEVQVRDTDVVIIGVPRNAAEQEAVGRSLSDLRASLAQVVEPNHEES
jgi:anaerobic ribonucleoside-triphosphate reductase activating protein